MGQDQKRVFLAVALSGLVLIVWQAFFAPKVKVPPTQQTVTEKNEIPVDKGSSSSVEVSDNKKEEGSSTESNLISKTVSSNGITYVLNSNLSVADAINPDAVYSFQATTGHEMPFQVKIIEGAKVKDIDLTWKEASDGSLLGVNQDLGVTFKGQMGEKGRFSFSLVSNDPHRFRLRFNSTKKEDGRLLREFLFYQKDIERTLVGDAEELDVTLKWLGIDYNYHLFAFVFPEEKSGKLRTVEKGTMVFDTLKASTHLEGDVLFVKKNYDELLAMGDKLDMSIDFGYFRILAVPILRGLQFFQNLVSNYGVAIILLTLIIRLITFPLQYKSFKSMKKMQKIQPELTKIKEKYKDDMQRQQKETMELFKRAGANPLGGCWPMLLQIPIFFAFYQVLYGAVELIGAPFFGWIQDLSIKDPYYVLPVLMALSFFLQQKLTPSTTTDPTQKKIMLFMPLIFGFIMKDLPSGLVLYILVSTLFGMAQQLFVYKTVD